MAVSRPTADLNLMLMNGRTQRMRLLSGIQSL